MGDDQELRKSRKGKMKTQADETPNALPEKEIETHP
jgi:hypothetical protein